MIVRHFFILLLSLFNFMNQTIQSPNGNFINKTSISKAVQNATKKILKNSKHLIKGEFKCNPTSLSICLGITAITLADKCLTTYGVGCILGYIGGEECCRRNCKYTKDGDVKFDWGDVTLPGMINRSILIGANIKLTFTDTILPNLRNLTIDGFKKSMKSLHKEVKKGFEKGFEKVADGQFTCNMNELAFCLGLTTLQLADKCCTAAFLGGEECIRTLCRFKIPKKSNETIEITDTRTPHDNFLLATSKTNKPNSTVQSVKSVTNTTNSTIQHVESALSKINSTIQRVESMLNKTNSTIQLDESASTTNSTIDPAPIVSSLYKILIRFGNRAQTSVEKIKNIDWSKVGSDIKEFFDHNVFGEMIIHGRFQMDCRKENLTICLGINTLQLTEKCFLPNFFGIGCVVAAVQGEECLRKNCKYRENS